MHEHVGILVPLTMDKTVAVSAETLEERTARFEKQKLPRASLTRRHRARLSAWLRVQPNIFLNALFQCLSMFALLCLWKTSTKRHPRSIKRNCARDEHSPTGPGHKKKRREKQKVATRTIYEVVLETVMSWMHMGGRLASSDPSMGAT